MLSSNSAFKPIHATWLVELNLLNTFFTSTEGKVYDLKGWEKAGIKDVFNGKKVLPPVDPYQDTVRTSFLLLCTYIISCVSVMIWTLLIKLFDRIQGHVD